MDVDIDTSAAENAAEGGENEKNTGTARQSKQSVVYDYLRSSIISGKLPPEKPLIEREICDKLGVSRTPVREAFRRLSSEGLVDFTSGKGVAVSGITTQKAEQMYELKEALECMAARLSAERATPEELAAMKRCIAEHQEAYESNQFAIMADIDLQFHIYLVESAKSPLIEQQAKSLLMQVRRLSQLSIYDVDQTENFIAQHTAIYEAILAQDGAAAAQRVREHIASVKKFQWERWRMLF